MKIIPGFSRYKISAFGMIYSYCQLVAHPHGYKLKERTDKDGYLKTVIFSDKNKRHNMRVARLVAMAYIGKIPNGMVVNHKDGNKVNNHFSNLEIITAADNERHARNVLGKRCLGEKASRSKLKTKDVIMIRTMYQKGHFQWELAEMFGVKQTQISRIIRKRNWSHV